jgi:uncharacterized protein (DUF2147 family)
MLKNIAGVVMLCISGAAFCQTPPPVGLWKTLSDKNDEAESLVRIIEVSGEFQGVIETIFSPPAPSPNPLCEQCKGELKNKPIVGMQIMKGLRRSGDTFSGGEILDPDEGNSYKCTVRVINGGTRLEVRGYIGISLFGRTQVWLRQE